jgi:predicted DNA-binding protein
MPTSKKRVALAVPDEIDEVLTKVSRLTGTPKTAVIVELLESSVPLLLQTIQAIELARAGNKDSAMNLMAGMLKDAGFSLDQAQHDFFGMRKDKP